VGTWVYEQMNESENDGLRYASLSEVLTLRIRADGSIEQWRRRAAGRRGRRHPRPGQAPCRGPRGRHAAPPRWRLRDAPEFQPAARYRFDTPYLVTESNTGQMQWQRR